MINWQPHLDREAALKVIETKLAENQGDIALQFERACLLTSVGRIEEAKQAYLKILSRDDPTHLGTLNNLGAILNNTGYRSAARTVYMQAVTHHADDPTAHVNLANLLLEENDFAAARIHYEETLRLDPDQAQAHQGMTRIFSGLRDEAGASRHRERGFRNQAIVTLPYHGKAPPVRLLLLVAADGGNIPRQHIDNHVFETTAVFADFYDPKKPLPPHHLVFNTIGDADLCRPALDAAVKLLADTSAPILNPPEKVMQTGRLDIARRLTGLAGVKTAKTFLFPKEKILEQQGLDFPLLLRAPGFHTGQHFVKVDEQRQLAAAVAPLPGTELLAMEYLDARGVDGLARKYRVMIIDGKLYPLHLAISHDWKVHYFTAAMAGQPQHQAEEKKFLEDMPSVIGPRGMAALERIKNALGLDYGGVDFGLDVQGNILLFEANAAMVINLPAPEEQWAYRRSAIDLAVQAVREMLLQRVSQADTVLPGNMV